MVTSVILGYNTTKKKYYVFTLNIENEKDILEPDVKLWYKNPYPGNPDYFELIYSNTSIRLADELSQFSQNRPLTSFHLFYIDINFDPKIDSYNTQLYLKSISSKDKLNLICLGELSCIIGYDYNKNLELCILYELAKYTILKFHCFQTNFS